MLEAGPVVGRTIARRLPSFADREGVAGETWYQAVRSVGRYLPERDPRAWVVGICRLVCRSERRALGRAAGRAIGPVPRRRGSLPPVWVHEAHEHLATAVMRLPRREREVVFLRYQHGYDAADIARVLGVDVSVVRHTLRKALLRLQEGDRTKTLRRCRELLAESEPAR